MATSLALSVGFRKQASHFMNQSTADHCVEINRCNQRGGRMLSIFDLIERQTLDIDLAAFLMTRICQGDSFLVGARPGGAGKTTVMGALLGLIPANRQIVPATQQTLASIRSADNGDDFCVVCHEISPGRYYSYLWGDDLREYCSLLDRGCMLATNLHADTLEESKGEICGDNGVPLEQFNAFSVQVYLRVEGSYSSSARRIEEVFVSNRENDPRLVFSGSKGVRNWKNNPKFEQCRSFLQKSYDNGLRTIEETRGAVVGFLTSNPLS